MFNSGILDVVIGLVFVYLMLSLICTALNELIEARIKWRAVNLEKGIRNLLNEPDGRDLVTALYNHPLISCLYQGVYDPARINAARGIYKIKTGTSLPSYIPARSFALAMLDIVSAGREPEPPVGAKHAPSAISERQSPADPPGEPQYRSSIDIESLKSSIARIRNPHVARALITLIDAAQDDIRVARSNIEQWFDSSMDRVSGWYKRRQQTFSFLVGLLIVGAVNVDSIHIARTLSSDGAIRDAMVATATEYARRDPSRVTLPDAQSMSQACQKDRNSADCRIGESFQQIRELGLPIGWSRYRTEQGVNMAALDWFTKLIGWLLTAIAISLGAPFWFDVLNKFMVVRATVKPREKSPDAPTVDRA